MIVSANPSSNTILPTVQEKTNPAELPATVTTTAVPFVPNALSLLKTVLTDALDTTPVTGVPPASPIPTVTFPTNPAPMAVRLTTVVRSAPPVNPTPIAVRRRFPVTTDVPRPTPAVSVPLVRATRIAMLPQNPAITVVLQPIPAESAPSANPNPYAIPALQTGVPFTPLATVTAVLTEALNPATPDAAAPVATPTLVPVFPAGLTLIAPVDLATVTPAMRAMPARDVLKYRVTLVQA